MQKDSFILIKSCLIFFVIFFITSCSNNAKATKINLIPPIAPVVTLKNGKELLALVDTKGNQLVDKESETFNLRYTHTILSTSTNLLVGNQKALFGDANPLDYLDDKGSRPTGLINYFNEESALQIVLASIYKLDTVDFFAGASNYISYSLLYEITPDQEWNSVKSILSFVPTAETDIETLNSYNFNATYYGLVISHISPLKNKPFLENKEVVRGSVVIDVKLRSDEIDKISGRINFLSEANKKGWLDVHWDASVLIEKDFNDNKFISYQSSLYESSIKNPDPIGSVEIYFFGSVGEEIGGLFHISRGLQFFDLIGAFAARRF